MGFVESLLKKTEREKIHNELLQELIPNRVLSKYIVFGQAGVIAYLKECIEVFENDGKTNMKLDDLKFLIEKMTKEDDILENMIKRLRKDYNK